MNPAVHSGTSRNSIAFLWENFGPMHVDRCNAVVRLLGGRADVIGIEFTASSSTYEWDGPEAETFRKITLYPPGVRQPGAAGRAWALIRHMRQHRAGHIFFCHYSRPEVFVAAWTMRLLGARVFVMSCSKFDDKPRTVRGEFIKSIALSPFQGGISSGTRAKDYLRFLGVKADAIVGQYNTLSVARMRAQATAEPAPGGAAHSARNFVVVARMVPKKNLATLLRAFAIYRQATPAPRRLIVCGSGPQEADLRALADELGIVDLVVFRGFVQSDAVSGALADGLALLLPSIEEQFGNVVIEAQALGLPVILSDVCGARDRLVRTGVNGFVIEPDNPEGLAYFMGLLADDCALWTRMSIAAAATAEQADDARFAEGVAALYGPGG